MAFVAASSLFSGGGKLLVRDGRYALPCDTKLVQAPLLVFRGIRIMPLHYGKIFAIIALLTVGAFILWQLWVAIFAGETVEEPRPAAFNQGKPEIVVASLAVRA
jgi:hypothetical protein